MWLFFGNIPGRKEPRYFNTRLDSESETANSLKFFISFLLVLTFNLKNKKNM